VTNFKVIKATTINGEKRKKGDIIDVVPCNIEKYTARGLIEVITGNDETLLEEIIEIIENDDDFKPVE
tara:strand:+ start:1350 stop:1553 length:204 start_codon:yes stop_codon:yes gene_type:complete